MVWFILLMSMIFFQIRPCYNDECSEPTAKEAVQHITAYMEQNFPSPWDGRLYDFRKLQARFGSKFWYLSCTHSRSFGAGEVEHLRYIVQQTHDMYGNLVEPPAIREYRFGIERQLSDIAQKQFAAEVEARWHTLNLLYPRKETEHERRVRLQREEEFQKAREERELREVVKQREKKARDEVRYSQAGLPMKCAIEAGDLAYVRLLLSVNATSYEKYDGKTMVQWATLKQRPEIVDELIRHKADVNTQSFRTKSCLALACRLGNAEITERLLKAGARYYTGYFDKTPLRELIKGISHETEAKHLACLALLLTHKKNDPHFLFPHKQPFRLARHSKSCTRSRCTFHRVVGTSQHGAMTKSQKKIQQALVQQA